MKTVSLQQGTPEWLAWRQMHMTASDAGAMLGISEYTKRDELLRGKKTGWRKEVSGFQKNLYQDGHDMENKARMLLELEYGTLYPAIATHDDYEWLAASFDGITLDETLIFEHKMWSKKRSELAAEKKLLPMDYAQVQQQLLVSGAEKCLFVVSDGTLENREIVEVTPDAEKQAEIIAGWEQFMEDLKTYEAPMELERNDKDWQVLAFDLQEAKRLKDEADARYKEISQRAIDIATECNAAKIAGFGVTVSRVNGRLSTDYKALIKDYGVDVSKYQKTGNPSYRITVAS